MSEIHLKVQVGEVHRRFRVQKNVSLSGLVDEIRTYFEDSLPEGRFHLRYMDDEGDWCTFETESEWEEAKSIFSNMMSKGPMKVQVVPGDSRDLARSDSSFLISSQASFPSSSSMLSSFSMPRNQPQSQHVLRDFLTMILSGRSKIREMIDAGDFSDVLGRVLASFSDIPVGEIQKEVRDCCRDVHPRFARYHLNSLFDMIREHHNALNHSSDEEGFEQEEEQQEQQDFENVMENLKRFIQDAMDSREQQEVSSVSSGSGSSSGATTNTAALDSLMQFIQTHHPRGGDDVTVSARIGKNGEIESYNIGEEEYEDEEEEEEEEEGRNHTVEAEVLPDGTINILNHYTGRPGSKSKKADGDVDPDDLTYEEMQFVYGAEEEKEEQPFEDGEVAKTPSLPSVFADSVDGESQQQEKEEEEEEKEDDEDDSFVLVSSSGSAKDLLLSSGGPGMPVARLVSHIKHKDGDAVCCGEWFTKTWRIGNPADSCKSWPSGCYLKWIDGEKLEGCLDVQVLCPVALKPRETADFTVRVRAPSEVGHYIAFFRLFTPDHMPFGSRQRIVLNTVPRISATAETTTVYSTSPVVPEKIVEPQTEKKEEPVQEQEQEQEQEQTEPEKVGEKQEEEEEEEIVKEETMPACPWPENVALLEQMGFPNAMVRFALDTTHGELEPALEKLLALVENMSSKFQIQ